MKKDKVFETDVQIVLEEVVLVLLMGSSEVKERIEKIYYENELKHKELAMNYKLETVFANGLQAIDKWNLVRFKSVLENKFGEDNSDERREFIFELIKVSHKRIYDFAVNNRNFNVVLFDKFMKTRIEKNSAATEEGLSDLYLYIHVLLNKEKPVFLDSFSKMIMENLVIKGRPYEQSFNYIDNNMSDESKKEALKFFEELTGKRWRNNEAIYLDEIFEMIEHKALDDNPKIARQVRMTGNSRLSYHVRPLAYLRHAMSFVQMHGYDNHYFFKDVKITKDEWIKLYGIYSYDIYKKIELEERGFVMMYSLMMFGFHKNYDALESDFWALGFKKDMIEVEYAEKELQSRAELLEKEKEKVNLNAERLENENEELKKKIEALEAAHSKEVMLLQAENDKMKAENDLMKALSTALFVNEELDEQYVLSDVNDMDDVKSVFAEKKIVLVGGHDSFRRKFAEEFEGVFVISPDELHVGEAQIKAADYIVFETSYNNHGQFNRVKKYISGQKILFVNQSKSLKLLGKYLKEQM